MNYILILCTILILNIRNECKAKPLKFAVIGDWGGIPIPPFATHIEKETAKELIKITNNNNVDFILALGDNFYFDGVENEYDSRFNHTFEKVFEELDPIIPWYLIAGNHDWKGNVSAQIAYSNHSTRWRFPNYFYSLEHTSYLEGMRIGIIMLDTIILCGKIDSDFHISQPPQYKYVVDEDTSDKYWKSVEDTLFKYKNYDYIIVTGHYPVWSVGEHGPTQCLVDRLDPLLQKYNVSAYLNGHDHTLEHIKVNTKQNEMNYFTIGAANFCNNSSANKDRVPSNSLKYHWMNDDQSAGLGIVTIDSDKMNVTLLSSSNEKLYDYIIKPRSHL